MFHFKAIIEIIGVNPYILLPEKVLNAIFKQAQKNKGPIPVRGKINGVDFIQHLVKYSGKWRLYLNTPMRSATNTKVGDKVSIQIEFDPIERKIEMHPKLLKALKNDKTARKIFDELSPSLKKEIVRYIHNLKTEESKDRNVTKAIDFLKGKQRWIGRDRPYHRNID